MQDDDKYAINEGDRIHTPEEPTELDEFQSILVISLNRIYDAQMAVLSLMHPEKAQQLADMHELGLTLAPPAAIYYEEDEQIPPP